MINILGPDVIVLGGGLSNVERLETVPSLWCPHVFSDHVATRLVQARHGIRRGAGRGLVVARLTVLPRMAQNGGRCFGAQRAETPGPDGLRP